MTADTPARVVLPDARGKIALKQAAGIQLADAYRVVPERDGRIVLHPLTFTASNPGLDDSAAAASREHLTPEARRDQPQGGRMVVELMPGAIGVSPTGVTSRPFAGSELAARITALSSTRPLGDRQ